ncbi:MAG: DUF72 domain-containing protein [Firmicutes bacterium]|nr:DUF72 domain-containing protein [Bacillota bacterium]
MILVGTSGFSYPDWRGSFYPENLDERNMLAFYAGRFRVVELNFSYYRMPSARTLGAMAAKTPHGFEFAIKAHQSMTHDIPAELSARDAAFREFRTALRPLEEGDRLGCVLFQFPWRYRPTAENVAYLGEIRDRYPDLPLVVEFRNIEWDRPETYATLRERGLGYCCVDEPRLKGLLPRQSLVTSPVGYVRFHGRNAAKWYDHKEAWERYDYLYSREELEEWVPRLREMEGRTEKTYVLYNNCHAGQAARNAQMMLDLLGLGGTA